MSTDRSCTHIKVTGVRCDSPALRGEQFCYFHQHAYRGVRRPPHPRLHPVALIESGEAIQASLMEVINGLIRNTIDVKRAELIIRALHIAAKNARLARFDSPLDSKVKEIPHYPVPAESPDAALAQAQSELPAVAAVSYKPVDPRDPHFSERIEEGRRVLAREAAERRAAEARATCAAQPLVPPAGRPSVPPAGTDQRRPPLSARKAPSACVGSHP